MLKKILYKATVAPIVASRGISYLCVFPLHLNYACFLYLICPLNKENADVKNFLKICAEVSLGKCTASIKI